MSDKPGVNSFVFSGEEDGESALIARIRDMFNKQIAESPNAWKTPIFTDEVAAANVMHITFPHVPGAAGYKVYKQIERGKARLMADYRFMTYEELFEDLGANKHSLDELMDAAANRIHYQMMKDAFGPIAAIGPGSYYRDEEKTPKIEREETPLLGILDIGDLELPPLVPARTPLEKARDACQFAPDTAQGTACYLCSRKDRQLVIARNSKMLICEECAIRFIGGED